MFCPNCGNQMPEGGRFCPNCGQKRTPDWTPSPPPVRPACQAPSTPPARPAPSISLNANTLLVLAGVVIAVLLAILIFRPGEDRAAPPAANGLGAAGSAAAEPVDPAAALVGSWSGREGVGLRFTQDGTLTLSGFGLDLGGDTFRYAVTGPNTLTLTAQVGGLVNAGFEVPYLLSGDGTRLQIELSGYLVELTKN